MKMRDEQVDLAAEVEAAWTGFRGRLADRLAGLDDAEILRIEVETGVDEDELEGAAPYLQFIGCDDLVRAEAVSNRYLDARFQICAEVEPWLVEGLWQDPDDEAPNYHQTVERREVDRLAVTCCDVLREVYGVAHPLFLDADGLEVDPSAAAWPTPGSADEFTVPEDEDLATVPHSAEELQQLVDRALLPMFPDLKHDEDGDVPSSAASRCCSSASGRTGRPWSCSPSS